jgi:hypothetical protein
MTSKEPRYAGRPLLRLLECYVLRAIGHLKPGDEARLEAITPSLQQVYGGSGQWFEILEHVMGFEPEMTGRIKLIWFKNQAIARERSEVLGADGFARMFVDANFASSVGSDDFGDLG